MIEKQTMARHGRLTFQTRYSNPNMIPKIRLLCVFVLRMVISFKIMISVISDCTIIAFVSYMCFYYKNKEEKVTHRELHR